MKSGLYLLSIFVLSLSAVLVIFGAGNRSKPALDAGTQTAPQGMLLIETDSLLPFYISASEESNLNWQLYVKWLETVYTDNPEIAKNARPVQTTEGLWLKYNDPMNEHYFEHPAYQMYPVTGVSWFQILSYLEWKSDRLNEAILLKIQGMKPNWHQIESDIFNIEAYLNDQYYYTNEDMSIWPEVPGTRHAHRRPKTEDGIFFPDYRLPNEQEWEAAYGFVKQPENSGYIHMALSKHSFLDPWISYYRMAKEVNKPGGKNKIDYTYNFNAGVSEWLLDREGSARTYRVADSEMLENNGWLPFSKLNHNDSYGSLKEKDSTGRFDFHFVQISNVQQAIYMTPPYSNIFIFNTRISPNPFYRDTSYRDSMLQKWYETAYLTYQYYNGNSLTLEQYKKAVEPNMDYLIRDSIKYTYEKQVIYDNTGSRRKYISSNYRNPAGGISVLLPDSARADLGFRCVLPYTGQQVARKYKVKW